MARSHLSFQKRPLHNSFTEARTGNSEALFKAREEWKKRRYSNALDNLEPAIPAQGKRLALQNSCFPCHSNVKARDFMFDR
jgi:hypothetical protein